jgi:hypothetical protein
VANHPSHRFWIEGSNPNFQGLIGELAFATWLGAMPIEKYIEQRPIYKRDKGKDIVVGKYRIDVKTPALRVTPKSYHSFLIEAALVENNVADLYACQFVIKPDFKEVYLMGFGTPEDIMAFGQKKMKGDTIYGRVVAGYDGYLISAQHLQSPDDWKIKLKGLQINDTLSPI